jgi:cytochrome c556
MKLSTKRSALAAAVICALGAISATGLAQDKDKIIAERQKLMKDQGRDWVVVRNYTEGKADQAAALSAVASLSKSIPTVPNYFPPGTEGPAPEGKWGTKPEVWSEHDKFLAAVKKVGDQVAVLDAALRSGDKTKVDAAFKDLNICSACHDTFRAKLQ